MRRILRATTAIVTSISLVLPQIAVAQELPRRGEQQQQQQKPKPQQQKPKAQQQKPNAQKAQGDAPRKQQGEQPQRRQADQQPRKAQAEQPQRQPQRQAQQPRPEPQQRAQQPQQPKAQQPKPQPQKPQQAEQQRQPQKPQPQQKPQQNPRAQADAPRPNGNSRGNPEAPARAQQQQPPRAANGNAQPPNRQQGEAPRNAEDLRRAMQQREGDNAPGQRPNGAGQQPPRAANGNAQPPNRQQGEAPRNAEDLRRAMQQREGNNAPGQRPNGAGQGQQPPRAGDPQQQAAGRNNQMNVQRLTPQQLQERVREGNGEVRLPPPELAGRQRNQQNDIARRAAEGSKLGPAAALAGRDGDDQGRVSEHKISRDDVRRSDQDFRTNLRDGQRRLTDEEMRRDLERRRQNLTQEEREADRREDRLDRRDAWLDRREDNWNDRDRWNDGRDGWRDNDDDNDRGSDIAKLLLAGAAGFAVGKMMSGNRQVALNTGDRAVLTLPDGSQQIVRDDNALLYQPGSDVRTETYQDGSTRTVVARADGSQVVTIRDADMNVLRRTLIRPDGSETRLIDDTAVRPVDVATLPAPQPVAYSTRPWQEDELRRALLTETPTDRRFTLGQIRDIPEVRSLVAPVNVPEITFDTNSAALTSAQAEQLATVGKVIRDAIDQNPKEVFMIEGYTDAVGSNAANLALSDRRAESVALALTEYFQVPPENMVVQGYGEQYLLVDSDADVRENRRVGIRRITDLLEQG